MSPAMRSLRSVALFILLLAFSSSLAAQRVTIKAASPSDVVIAMQKRLSAQGFKLAGSSKKGAMFTLDRGMVSQTAANGMPQSVHVILEFHLWFKQEADSLQVEASEEVVAETGVRSMDFRKVVQTPAEHDSMQRLLDDVKAELEARPPAP
jgi:hypothetical protein